uniref:NB-ARC domain-containing protein n=1 Tax=Nelumbo nucifera TaxID=4432 RepID=A0A822ZFZ2_NELNU|nr:TPA_asm: hypothetical protein HUJ06_000599 [Nelumbo nucifera]
MLNLMNTLPVENMSPVGPGNIEREQTHSFVCTSNVRGRKEDKEKIINLLLSCDDVENEAIEEKVDVVSIIPIVGIRGLGKTTLAQLVYNDLSVVNHFNLRIWVCVSDEFDVKKLTEKIIRSTTNAEFPNLDIDQLQARLRKELDGKRYLLVLDDVWNEDQEKWVKLRSLLVGVDCRMGSKIVKPELGWLILSMFHSLRKLKYIYTATTLQSSN